MIKISMEKRVNNMYDYELRNYINKRNGHLNQHEYLHICNTCPQLREIKYEPFQNIFKAWSDANEYFEFTVTYQE